MGVMLSEFDRAVLNAVQKDLPITSRPFAVLAERLHTDEETLIACLSRLKEAGYIRRFGAYFDSGAFGYKGTLVALHVKPGYMEATADVINRYATITHNYEREGEYNLWFTLQSASEDERQDVLGAIRALPGVDRMLDLRSEKTYKVRVQFEL